MNLGKLYRNPEVKRATIKYIVILIIGIIVITATANILINKLNKKIITQNILTLSKVINNEDISKVISTLYNAGDKEDLEKARELLKSYGYDESVSIDRNEYIKFFSKEVMWTMIPIYIFFITLMYLLFITELKSLYNKIEDIVLNVSSMSKGKYKEIEGSFDNGELGVLISSLNYMGDRVNNSIYMLKKEKENLKDFLADISHQLKTPLASLVMFNDLLRENENMPYEDRIKFLDKSEEQLNRMEWLIMNLLKVGRIEAGAIIYNEYRQPLRDTIDTAVSSLKGVANKKNQDLIIKGDLDVNLYHDKEWLAEALSNIIKNAIENTAENGKIIVEVSNGPLITKIFIRDNGKGIPKDMQNKIFKRFYKGENSTNPKSIGIGLSLSKAIIENLGGEIKLISEENKGTTFIISFIESLRRND